MNMPFQRPASGNTIPKDYFGRVWDLLKSMQISGDGKYILVTKTRSGTTIKFKEQPPKHEAVPGGGNESYNGMFKVIADTENNGCVKVVCGYNMPNDADGKFAGIYIHAYQKKEVPVSGSIGITQSGYVYIEITYDTDYVFTYTLTAGKGDKITIPLAYITVEKSAVKSILQVQYGALYTPGVI